MFKQTRDRIIQGRRTTEQYRTQRFRNSRIRFETQLHKKAQHGTHNHGHNGSYKTVPQVQHHTLPYCYRASQLPASARFKASRVNGLRMPSIAPL